jgi:hypothetical protein
VIINPCTLGCLKTIGTIFKNLFKENYFEEPHFFVINRFINEEKDRLKQFFREIIHFDETIEKPRRSKIFEKTEIDKTSGMMYNYFVQTVKRSNVPQFSFNSQTQKQFQHMNEMKEFKITTIMLSIDEIRFLAKLFEEKDEEIIAKG